MRPRDDDPREVEVADALRARHVEKYWRNWKAFIAEKQDEFSVQQADDSPDADLTGAARPAPRKAKLDSATRQQFGALLEARRQQWQAKAEQEARQQSRPAPDTDEVYASLLQRIADELDGKIHPSGMALLYYKDVPKPIKFDKDATMAGTTDADYLAAGSGGGPTRQQVLLLLGMIGAMLIVLFFMVRWAFGSDPADVVQASSPARVGQQSAALWSVDTAAVGPAAAPARMTGAYPAVLCISEAQAKAATLGATVVLTGTQAIRRYQVQPGTSAREADLLLSDCGASPPRPEASARLIETRTRQLLETAALRAVTVRGPDLDPQVIPPDQMEVTLELAIPDAGAGTLILADGRRWAATRSEAVEGGTRLVYLVPLAQTAQPAGFELPRGGELPALLATLLPAPTSRATLLRRLLDVQAGARTIMTQDGEEELALTLTVTLSAQAAPLTLLPTDLLVQSGNVPIAARWDAPTLAPGKPTEIAVRVPLRAGEPLEIALASWRARVTTE
jgi:hypothetical protein